MNIEMYNNNILFKPFELNPLTDGGIFIPDSYKTLSNKGVIVATGEGTPERSMKLKKGMIGYRVKDWGTEIIIEGEKYFIMEDKAILALEG